MNTFFTLNKKKLLYIYIATASIFLTTAFLFLIIGYYFKNAGLPEFKIFAAIILGTGVAVPLFIIGMAYIEWFFKMKIRANAFQEFPFNKLDQIGFSKDFLNTDTKWYFTEEVRAGEVNGFRIICDVQNHSTKTAKFKAFTKIKHLPNEDFIRIKNRFNDDDIAFDFDGIVKIYSVNNQPLMSIEELKTDLEKFTLLLKSENFEPEKI